MSLVRVAAAATLGQWMIVAVLVTAMLTILALYFTYAGGWRELARAYPATTPYAGRRWRMAWASMRGSMGFGPRAPQCLDVGADEHGLRLDTYLWYFPWLPLAPALHIPWSDIAAARAFVRFSAGEVVELSFARVPGVPLRIYERLADDLVLEVGSLFSWGAVNTPPRARATAPPGMRSAPLAPGRMRCPQCSLEQAQAAECTGCGLVVAKYHREHTDGTPADPDPAKERVLKSRARQRAFFERLRAHTRNVWLTPALIAACVFMYMAMVAGGVDPLRPHAQGLVLWGAGYGPRTTAGEWWRLASAMFVHVGLVHLAFNMLALWLVGPLVERLTGNVGLLLAYLVSGVCASLTSIAWHPALASAGASGAIFGLYGTLLGWLVRERASLPRAVVQVWQVSAVLFVTYDISYSLGRPGIDLPAHAGGLAAGFVCGLLLAAPVTDAGAAGRPGRNLMVVAFGVIAVAVGVVQLPRGFDLLRELEQFAPINALAGQTQDDALRKWQAGQMDSADFATVVETLLLHEWQTYAAALTARTSGAPPAHREQLEPLFEHLRRREECWQRLLEGLRQEDPQRIEDALWWEKQVRAYAPRD